MVSLLIDNVVRLLIARKEEISNTLCIPMKVLSANMKIEFLVFEIANVTNILM